MSTTRPQRPPSKRHRGGAVVASGVLAATLAAPGLPATAAPTPADTAPRAAAEAPAPAAHYAFDAAAPAAVVPDGSGNGRDATLVNVATAAVTDGAHPGSHALVLPGGSPASDGAYVSLPRPVLEGATDLTVSARVRWDGGTAPWQWLVALGTDSSRYLFTTPASGDGPLRTAVTTVGGGAEDRVTGSAALPAGAWHTVTTTLDTTTDLLTTYLDGAPVGSVTTTVTAGDLLTAGAAQAGFVGRSFYPDPLFAGAVDDLAVYHAALTPAQVAGLVDEVPQPTGVAQDAFAVTTAVGEAPALPATVTAAFSDGYDRPVAVTWDAVDPAQYASRGTFAVQGTAAGARVIATVRVIHAGELVVDLGSDTGPFHGGASGTLYGLYGQDLPTNNLLEGMHLRTVSTKAQDGPQHPGADALEVVRPLADSTDGDVYIYMTDIHRGFPYQWPGDTPEEKLALYREKIETQVDQVLQLEPQYQDNIVFVPFNEPEGNMFGTGEWSYDGTSWLTDPTDYFAAWDDFYRLIKGRMPDARIAGPNTSILFAQVKGFLEHTVEAGTVPDVVTWHELSDPAKVTSSVATYRSWEPEVFDGTPYEGRQLPININEYAFNYHTSVPGQMIQWVSAIEAAKVDADIAYWNIDGNLSDSAVQANRANGQWWLLNAYGSMTGHTVEVTPPSPATSYTLQGVATLDEDRKQARLVLGGADGPSWVQFDDVPKKVFGSRVHALVREIRWTGQIGDSRQPEVVAELDLPVRDGAVVVPFGSEDLPPLTASSAYEVVLTPGTRATPTQVPPTLWRATYEAEDAAWTGTGYSRNGPEGSPADVGRFFTSGGYDVGGLRTGSDVTLSFDVEVPQDGTYDLSVFANSLNTYPLVAQQGPTNVFLTVDGAAEQELFLPLGYKWVVWDHTDTQVELTAGRHTLRLAARSLDGSRSTLGDAIVDKLDLSLADPAAAQSVYEAELAELDGARTAYGRKASGGGVAELRRRDEVTFWVYSRTDGESTLHLDTLGSGDATLHVNGHEVADVRRSTTAQVFLSGGVNKVTVTGVRGTTVLDRLRVQPTTGTLVGTTYEAEDARLGGTAAVAERSLAAGGTAVTGIGGEPGNGNTLTFDVSVRTAGRHALTIRYANPEQSPATHYNPDPLARHADLAVNGGDTRRVVFPHTFHENSFWELTVPVDLRRGRNTLTFSSQELPSFDGTTLISDVFPDVLLRSQYAPDVDRVTVTPFAHVGRRGR